MNRLEKLIKEYCPDGVKHKTLGEIGAFYGGLTGKSKDDFKEGNAVLISYMNVYSNPALNIHPADKVQISESETQRTLQYGDIVFTGSSETPDECGIASVVTDHPTEPLYLNSFCFFIRLNNSSILNPSFAKHLFRSKELRHQIGKTANGVTRFNVSKDKMKKIKIPVPPLPVQEEIARILDTFTMLTAELKAELTARKAQYEYYAETIFNGLRGIVPNVKLSSLGKWSGGKTPSMANKKYWENGTVPWISSKDMKKSVLSDTQDHITEYAVSDASMTLFPSESIAVVTRSGILKHTFPISFIPFATTVNQDIKILAVNENNSSKYVFLAMKAYAEDIRTKTKKQGGTVDSLDFQKVMEYTIPLPERDAQEMIVKKLEQFDALCSDLTKGLPAEIEARQKQYEYYRDKLLTFKDNNEN